MSCSRRNFLTGMVISTVGIAGTATFNGVQAVSPKPPKKRYGMLFDETACIGCNACSEACREVNDVPEGVSRLTITRSNPMGEYPNTHYKFDRISCQHCDNAPCVYVCPTGAAYIEPDTGIVDVNSDKCVGCGYCLAACPYQVRFFHPQTGSADKCNFCRDTNLAQGKQPACVEKCPTGALVFGDLDNPNSTISQAISQKTVYRQKVELGTSPKLYKVPHEKGEI